MDLIPTIASTLATLGVIGGFYAGLRRWRAWQVAQGPRATGILTQTLQDTMAAQSAEIATLRRQIDDGQKTILEMALDFKGCKQRLIALERLVADKAIADAGH